MKHTSMTSRRMLISYILGFVLSVALTLFAFAVSSLGNTTAIVLILIAALIQLAIQLIFFLHLSVHKGKETNATIFALTFIIVAILAGGTLWIMHNLERLHMESPSVNDLYEHGVVSPAHELK